MRSISVIVPTYNGAAFLPGTLGSVFAQTQPPAEVLVADDGSTDDTVAVAERIAASAPVPVRVVRLPANTGGPSGPLNVGIRAARGDLIATLDHDDQMAPDKLERQLAAFAAAPDAGVVFHAVEPVGSEHPTDLADYLNWVARALADLPGEALGDGAKRVARRDAYSQLAEGNFTVSCSTMLFPKRVWRAVGGFEPWFRAACDYAFIERVARAWDLVALERPLVRWHRHGGTLTSAAGVNRSVVESWRVLSRIARRSGEPAVLARLTSQAEDLLGVAYKHRTVKQRRQAWSLYRTLLWNRPSGRVALAAAKFFLPTRPAH